VDWRGIEGAHPLLLPLGNENCGDDAAGLEIVRRLLAGGLDESRIIDLPRSPLDWKEIARTGRPVLVVDSVVSGSPPGTIHLAPIPGAALRPRGAAALSTHGMGLLESLSLAQALGVRLPRLILLGIECGDVSPGAPLSGAVENAIAQVTTTFAELQDTLADPDFRLESVQPWPAT
jgi:hydrogenase maturation protease